MTVCARGGTVWYHISSRSKPCVPAQEINLHKGIMIVTDALGSTAKPCATFCAWHHSRDRHRQAKAHRDAQRRVFSSPRRQSCKHISAANKEDRLLNVNTPASASKRLQTKFRESSNGAGPAPQAGVLAPTPCLLHAHTEWCPNVQGLTTLRQHSRMTLTIRL